ncbi:MAG TPA: ferrous iron transport protein B [Thermoprotei archaeon]|nr:ferrous iron transport protein B [Thermoprotei archaeon]
MLDAAVHEVLEVRPIKRYPGDILVALVGSPNVGKTTLFNVLAGEIGDVANWPGVTVTINVSRREHEGKSLLIVDLPGVYSLVPQSAEERITRDFILRESPDVVLVIVDSVSLEKSLYLAVQILEMFPRTIIALNKIDIAHKRGEHINVERLSKLLGTEVIAISARTGENLHYLLDTLVNVPKRGDRKTLRVNYGVLEKHIEAIEGVISKYYPKEVLRAISLQILEGDESLLLDLDVKEREEIREIIKKIKEELRGDPSVYIAGKRYEYIEKVLREARVKVPQVKERAQVLLDKIFYTPVLGSLVSFLILLGVFVLAVGIGMGAPLTNILSSLGASKAAEVLDFYNPSSLIDLAFSELSMVTANALEGLSVPRAVIAVIVDGIIGGVGTVMTFVPPIFIFYILFSFIEDSGLYARMSISMSKTFELFGLSPRAAFPMTLSLGCNVPGIVASRTSIDDTERRQIIFSIPMIPCQARLVVLMAMSSYFKHGAYQALFIVSLYVLGITAFFLTSLFVRRIIYKIKEPPVSLIEIPNVHRPSLRVVWWTTLRHVKHFLYRILKIIVPLSIVAVLITSYGIHGYSENPQDTFGYYIGKALGYLFLPFGFNEDQSWVVGYGVLSGMIAKETFISSMEIMSGRGFENFLNTLSAAQVVGLTIFVNMYIPCFATIAIMLKEGHRKLVLQHLVYSLIVSYSISLIAYFAISLV